MSAARSGTPSFAVERDLARRALDTARTRGASYADVRFVRRDEENALVKNGRLESADRSDSFGFGVRAIADGAWGFAASQVVTADEADRVAALAVEIAKASALTKQRDAVLAPVDPHTDTYATPVKIDPFAMTVDERLGLLVAAEEGLRARKGLRTTRAAYAIWREDKLFLSSEGADIQQRLVEVGGGIAAEAVGDGELQIRSYPDGLRYQNSGGWEVLTKWDLVANAPRVADEALALLTAKPCPQDIRTSVILAGNQLSLQCHESCGHPIELDRALGSEAAFAGTSFLTTDKLGSYRYGSEQVSIRIDSTSPGGLGTFGFDDEGVPASEGWAVEDGLFVGYLMSRETAAALGTRSNGTMRADGWQRVPIIRMTNVSVMPGDAGTLDDLIADTDDGILMDTNRSWSIDDKRFNFQFGTEIGWEIKKGKRGDMVRNPTYTGITPEFWGSCDAVCSQSEWIMWGTPNCGKGQPGQGAHTGHGAAPARFRDVKVGVMR
ncbi:MAG TPA: TldD/PmbA family protein [Candidatus Limnocylindria bacterium]|nr:TldD/PmbA family protein [Candidatus Limnocylindria bacterium]